MGLNSQSSQAIIGIINTHHRSMAHAPVHLTRIPTNEFFTSFGLDPPWNTLQKHYNRLTHALNHRREILRCPAKMRMWLTIQAWSYWANRPCRMRYIQSVQNMEASLDPYLMPPVGWNLPTNSLYETQYWWGASHECTRFCRSGEISKAWSALETMDLLVASKAFSMSNETWMPPHTPCFDGSLQWSVHNALTNRQWWEMVNRQSLVPRCAMYAYSGNFLSEG